MQKQAFVNKPDGSEHEVQRSKADSRTNINRFDETAFLINIKSVKSF